MRFNSIFIMSLVSVSRDQTVGIKLKKFEEQGYHLHKLFHCIPILYIEEMVLVAIPTQLPVICCNNYMGTFLVCEVGCLCRDQSLHIHCVSSKFQNLIKKMNPDSIKFSKCITAVKSTTKVLLSKIESAFICLSKTEREALLQTSAPVTM